jgi:tRNA threonylcarbamoyl adenosine modification protein YeaZ
MTILALEFSSPRRSVAIARLDRQAEVVETGPAAANAFGMIERSLVETKIEREEIEVLAVGLGPGSYTGVRAAISLAQGWQLSREVKLLGLSSVEAIVLEARNQNISGSCNVVIDAQRNEFYLAKYEIRRDGWQEMEPLKILPRAEVQSRSEAGQIVIGPEVDRWFARGRLIFPRAAALTELVRRRTDFVPGEKLAPIYLRETSYAKSPPRLTVS